MDNDKCTLNFSYHYIPDLFDFDFVEQSMSFYNCNNPILYKAMT